MVEDMVGLRGITVLQASSPTEALDLAERIGVDVILTDHELHAEATGLDLVQELRRRVPGIRSILMTGSLDPPDQAVAAFDAVLKKPFSMKDAARMIRHLLDAEG